MNIAAYIDHTILKPDATEQDIAKLCDEAKNAKFAAVCVPQYYVKSAKEKLLDTTVKVATVIGFPFGYNSTPSKVTEAKNAIEHGADELDIMINLAALKNGNWRYIDTEISNLIRRIRTEKKTMKLIVETGMLTQEEIIQCCNLVRLNHIPFIKTSTGYSSKGANIETVKLMRQHLPENISIKASGGIRTFALAEELIEAGANRIGCSESMKILEESKL